MEIGNRQIILTDAQRARLLQLIGRRRQSWSTYAPRLDAIEAEIRRSPAGAPPAPGGGDGRTVVIGSRVWLNRIRGDAPATWVVVEPDLADEQDGTLSVLSPLGWSLMGRRPGDLVSVPAGDGARSYRIARVSAGGGAGRKSEEASHESNENGDGPQSARRADRPAGGPVAAGHA